MKFIEMTSDTLLKMVDVHEIDASALEAAGVGSHSILRINLQGDIEVRRPAGWDVIGGLITDFEEHVKEITGLDWAAPDQSA